MSTLLIRPARQSLVLPLRFIAGVTLAMLLTLLIFLWAMRPPLEDFRAMIQYLAVTAVISVVTGIAVYRFGWYRLSPSLHWTVMSSYVLAALLTFLNVWTTARLMFINWHDLTLATILLIFAAGIAMSLGRFVTSTLNERISVLNRGAQAIARGELRTRVAIPGRDEIASLGRAFNQMADQLESAANKQRQLDKLRRELIAWVGHDLRTPLASVRAILEALDDNLVEDIATQQRYIRTAKRDIAALSLLVDDLFEMAQIDAGGLKLNRQPVALSDLLSDIVESFSAQASEKRIRLDGRVTPGVDPVDCDVRLISRVLNNLISNAIRYTPAGGAIDVKAQPIANGVEVCVCDTGEGIHPEDLLHIFERFYRGEKSRSRVTGGAGLGLAITKGIVEAHGGAIRAESTVGHGARFIFTLPRTLPTTRINPLRRT
jgi:signal transduction histidine kinase